MKKAKVIYLLLLILFLSIKAFSQSTLDDMFSFCPVGADFLLNQQSPTSLVASSTPQSAFSPTAIVTCGNFRVYYEDLQQQSGDGFDDPALGAVRRNTICAVLTYIQSVLKINTVVDLHIERSFGASNLAPLGTTFLAYASPVFKPGTYGVVAGFFGGNLYDHITSGFDPDASDYDATATFNFDKTYGSSGATPVNYWDDYANTTQSCKYDLFGLALHEFTHALGFLSAVADDGTSNHFITIKSNSLGIGSFTKLDEFFLYYGDSRTPATFSGNKLVTNSTPPTLNSGLSVIPNLLSNTTLTTNANSVWMTNNGAPNNYKAYDGYWPNNVGGANLGIIDPVFVGSFLSHLDGLHMDIYRGGQHSPGFQPRYVMGPAITLNQKTRVWSMQEMRMLLQMGYNLNTTFAASNSLSGVIGLANSTLLTQNSPPYRSNYGTASLVRFPLANPLDFTQALLDADNKPADYTIINTTPSTGAPVPLLTINLHTFTTIADPNGDPIGIYPNSFYGVKGVTTGGNNHNSIAFTNSYTIVYSPPPGFYGRAEFGFNLWDGKEKGGLKVITIDVQQPAVVPSLPAGSQLLINGGFEDATEVKTLSNPGAATSTRIDWHLSGLNYTSHQSGGHPYLPLTLPIGGYAGDGWGIIRDGSHRYCWAVLSTQTNNIGTNVPYEGFGSPGNSADVVPIFSNWINPMPVSTGTVPNECYHFFTEGWTGNGTNNQGMPLFSLLYNPLKTCGYYHLEFDATSIDLPGRIHPPGTLINFNLKAVNNLTNTALNLSYNVLQDIPMQYTVTATTQSWAQSNWQHVALDFVYCGVPTSTILISVPGQTNMQLPNNEFFFDNLSLKENTTPPPPLIVTATNSSTLFCPGSTATLTGHAINTFCQPHFTWQPMGVVNNSVAVSPPNPNVTYTLLANDGCRTGSAIVTPVSFPVGAFTASPICMGQISPYSLESLLTPATPTPGTFSGPGIVVGAGGNHFINPTPIGLFTPGVNNYTYTYVYPNGCSQNYTFSVLFLGTPTITATPPCIFSGQSSTLSIQPSLGTFTWYPGGQNTSSIVVSPTTTTYYDFDYNNGACTGKGQRFTVNVLVPVTFTNLPTGILCTNQTLTPLNSYLAPGVPLTGTWTASGGLTLVTNSLGTSAILSPTLATGTYTLSYSYTPSQATCTSGNSFTFAVSPGFSMTTSGPAWHCANLSAPSVITVTSSTSGLTFTWTPGNLTGATQSVTPGSTTIYTVTGNNGICKLTSTLSVIATTQCCVASSNITSSVISSGTIGGFGASTAINHDITITGPVCFSGEFLIAPNVSITVANGGTLTSTLRAMHLYACNDMWSGIVVKNGGRVNFSNGTDLIEDAGIAISCDASTNVSQTTSNYNIECNSVLFNRNGVGIVISNYTQTANYNTTYNSPFLINGCVFTSRDLSSSVSSSSWPNALNITLTTTPTNPLGSPYPLNNYPLANLKSPNSWSQQLFGVLVLNSGYTMNASLPNPMFFNILIGSATGTINLFDNLLYGLYSVNSNVLSYRNVFQNTRYITTNPILQGAGICAINNESNPVNYNNTLDIVSPVNSATNNNVFYNCHIGIKTFNMFNLNLQYAKFQSTQSVSTSTSLASQGYYGVNSVTNRFCNYYIKNNQFLNLRNGVYFGTIYHQLHIQTVSANGLYWGDVAIQNNLFSAALTPTTTIVNEFMDNGVVAENLISGIVPLYIINPTPLKIQNNNFSRVYRGVKLSGFWTISAGVNTSSNTIEIKQDPVTTNSQWCIKSELNYKASLRYNTLKGFATTTVNPNAGIYCTMNYNGTVQCNSETTLARGYQFAGSNFNSFWRNNTMQTSGQGLILSNSGFMGPQGNSLTPIDNKWLGTTWTLPANRSTYVDATSWAYNPSWTNPLTNPNNSVLWVRNTTGGGFIPQTNGGPVAQSYTVTNAIKLATNSASYFDCPSGGWIGQVGTGNSPTSQRLLNEAVVKDSLGYTDAATLEIHKTNLFRMIDVDTTLKDSSLILYNFYQTSKASNKGKLLHVEKLLTEYFDPTLANNLLQTIMPSTTVETNYKNFYNLTISYRNNGVLSAAENNSLYTLASKCPFTDGAVIYQARVLYNLVNSDVFNFEDNCTEAGSGNRLINKQSGSSSGKQELESQEINYKLYPNPAIDELHIFGETANEIISIVITDINNKQLLDKKISIQDYHAEIKLNLLNGVYFVTLANKENTHVVKKLIIAK